MELWKNIIMGLGVASICVLGMSIESLIKEIRGIRELLDYWKDNPNR